MGGCQDARGNVMRVMGELPVLESWEVFKSSKAIARKLWSEEKIVE